MFNMVENKLSLSNPRQPIPLAERVSSVIKKSHLEECWLPARNNPLTTTPPVLEVIMLIAAQPGVLVKVLLEEQRIPPPAAAATGCSSYSLASYKCECSAAR